jgi:hypoxanthine phosphoribosyltransferase
MKFDSKIYLDYNDIESMCRYLEDEVARFKPDVIVGIVRGGLVPALHFSHALDRPLVPIQWQTRDGSIKLVEPKIAAMLKFERRVAFIDDINDTGTTFSELAEAYEKNGNVFFVSLVEKVSSKYKSDVSALKIDDDRWIQFPWEKG